MCPNLALQQLHRVIPISESAFLSLQRRHTAVSASPGVSIRDAALRGHRCFLLVNSKKLTGFLKALSLPCRKPQPSGCFGPHAFASKRRATGVCRLGDRAAQLASVFLQLPRDFKTK